MSKHPLGRGQTWTDPVVNRYVPFVSAHGATPARMSLPEGSEGFMKRLTLLMTVALLATLAPMGSASARGDGWTFLGASNVTVNPTATSCRNGVRALRAILNPSVAYRAKTSTSITSPTKPHSSPM